MKEIDNRSGENIDMIDIPWLETCAQAGEFLYCCYPLALLKRLYELKKGWKLLSTGQDVDTEIVKAIENSSSVLMEFHKGVLDDEGMFAGESGFFIPEYITDQSLRAALKKAEKDGNPYALAHLEDNEHINIIAEQSDVDYYIPTEQEITELVSNGFVRTPAYTAFERFVISKKADPGFLPTMWQLISTGNLDQMEIPDYVGKRIWKEGIAPSLEALQEMLRYAMNFMNEVNRRDRRGWRPVDLRNKISGSNQQNNGPIKLIPGSIKMAQMMHKAQGQIESMGFDIDYDSGLGRFTTIGKYGEKVIVKVGRNDPCPCGSGKKYKRCHGR